MAKLSESKVKKTIKHEQLILSFSGNTMSKHWKVPSRWLGEVARVLTLLVKVESIVNARRLTYVYGDLDGISFALAPSHLNNGRCLQATSNPSVKLSAPMNPWHNNLSIIGNCWTILPKCRGRIIWSIYTRRTLQVQEEMETVQLWLATQCYTCGSKQFSLATSRPCEFQDRIC